MSVHCCGRMDRDLKQKCHVHKTRADCPDALVSLARGIVHDGGASVIEISFCPWCGSKLPEMADLSEFSN